MKHHGLCRVSDDHQGECLIPVSEALKLNPIGFNKTDFLNIVNLIGRVKNIEGKEVETIASLTLRLKAATPNLPDAVAPTEPVSENDPAPKTE